MEVTDDRGIECRGLCFSIHDREVSVSAYRDHPGVRRDLNEPYFHKHFTFEEWGEIADYLMQMRDAGPELVVDEDEPEKEPRVTSDETEVARKELEAERAAETERQKVEREREEKAKLEEEDATK